MWHEYSYSHLKTKIKYATFDPLFLVHALWHVINDYGFSKYIWLIFYTPECWLSTGSADPDKFTSPKSEVHWSALINIRSRLSIRCYTSFLHGSQSYRVDLDRSGLTGSHIWIRIDLDYLHVDLRFGTGRSRFIWICLYVDLKIWIW